MSRNLGTDTPSAVRASPPGWRDPRLWIGVAIVAVSVLAGARLLGSADDSVTVWAVRADMGAGDTVGADDLVAERVRFVRGADLGAYFTAEEALPDDLRLSRGVGAGELLPRAAVGPAAQSGLLQVPIAVPDTQVPDGVGPGSVVDVHLSATGGRCARGCGGAAVLTGVTVISAPAPEDGFAPESQRKLVLGVRQDDATRFFTLLASVPDPTLTVVGRG